MWIIISFANERDCLFTSKYFVFYLFIFLAFNTLTWAFRSMVRRNGDSIFVLFSTLKEMLSAFHHLE